MDVTINDLSPEQQAQLKDVIDQFQQKCLMSFAKNRSGVPYLKIEMPPNSTYKIAPANNRLQKNMYGGGYSEVMDYGAIDAFPNPGYGAAAGMQDDDILVQKMANVMQNQFGLKPKMQGPAYTPPFPEWYYRVILLPRVKPPTEFTKFSGQDDTSTVEHIARYLMQLGEASTDEAFRVRYFPLSLTGPAFQWFTSLPPQSVNKMRVKI
jgi:hypothetical protein